MGTKEKLENALKKDLAHPINRAIAAKALYQYTQSEYDAAQQLKHLGPKRRDSIMQLWYGHRAYRQPQPDSGEVAFAESIDHPHGRDS